MGGNGRSCQGGYGDCRAGVGVIDADGRIVKSLPLGKAGRIDTRLPTAKAPTLFARFGNILPLAFAALLIAFAFIPLARRRFSR